MTFRVTLKKALPLLLCICLCLGLVAPALAEDATGSEIRLLQTEGTVNVNSTSGKSYSTREDMRLYNGYVVSTEEASYAWITLDSDKAVKLDQCSSLEVRRSGKTLELLLKSGELFFNVTAPLKEDEKLNIRTSTMVTGVRGTAGWVRLLESGVSQVGILEGQVVCRVTNPFTGASRTLVVKAGQIGEFRVYEAFAEGEGAEAKLLSIGSADEISGFILEEILKDPGLVQKILEDTGLDFSGLTPEQVAEKLAEEQEEVRKKLKEVAEHMLEEVISKDPLWEGDQGGGESSAYTITWNIMGYTETTECRPGEVPAHAIPELAGYVFSGWYPTPSAANGNATYAAIFTPISEGGEPVQPEQPAQYTVTWIIDGIRSDSVYTEGVRPTHEDPVKTGYRFTGWDPPISTVTGNAEYTAVFEEINPTEYTITWLDDEGGELDVTRVTAGERPNYTGEQPTKAGYRFIGWDPEVTAAWEDAVYTAVFEEVDPEAETGTVTWIINGTEESEPYEIGAVPSHTAPSMEPSADQIFVFTGWYDGSAVYGPEDELPPVTGDTTYTAEFSSEPRSYTVTWVVEDERTEESWSYGERPTHEIPEKESTDQFAYEFTGWSDGTETYYEVLPPVTGDATYTAQILQRTREYTITWAAGDEEVEDQVAYGDTPVYGGPEPTKADDDVYRYTFNNTWDPEIVPVTGNATYTAQFDSTEIYTVTPSQPERGGALETDVTKAAEGEIVTVTVSANAGYDVGEVVAYYDLNGRREDIFAAGSGTEYTFEMPAADVTVYAVFEAQSFPISARVEPGGIDDIAVAFTVNGVDFDPDLEEVSTDDTVTIDVTWPSEYYVLDPVTVTWTDGTGAAGGPITATQSGDDEVDADNYITRTFTFTMPAGEAIVNVALREIFELYVGEGLLIQADVTVNGEVMSTNQPFYRVTAGTDMTVTIVPHAGYRLYSDPDEGDGVYVVCDAAVDVTKTAENTYTFTMPEESASLEVSMEEAHLLSIEYADYGGDERTGIVTATVNGETAEQAFEGDTVVLDVTLYNGYTVSFIGYYAGDSYNNIDPVDGVYSFEMPGTDVRVLVTLSS